MNEIIKLKKPKITIKNNKDEENIFDKLLPYQVPHVQNLLESLKNNNRALDASDTGTGKTYSALAVCKLLGLKPFIICPKSVLGSWCDVAKYFDIEVIGIANYELLQNCRYFPDLDLNNKVDFPFIKRRESNGRKHPQDTFSNHTFLWENLPEDCLIIFDEAHRCKNPRTVCSVLLYTLSVTQSKILMLSATISDKVNNFAIAGFVLGLYPSLRHAKNWINNSNRDMGNGLSMSGVHRKIYPLHASRMKIRDLGDVFPKNQILAECFNMDCAEEIEKEYKKIEEEVNRLKKREEGTQCVLARILYARMRIEQLKIPTMIELVRQFIEEGNSVAVFVNFTNSLQTIAEELKTNCLVYGEQTMLERNNNIKDFQEDRSNIIICNIRSGGVGISLHDTHGIFPRVSIISPSWSAQDIIQALGRVHRANGKTVVRQKIVFCRKTIEEFICRNMIEKIKNIASLNDGDLLSYQIDGLMDEDELGVEMEKLTEREITERKIKVLNIKKERLKEELSQCNQELKELLNTILS